jgi:hypothetical protein
VLPIRLWQEGTLLFVATAPSDPDRRLGLLEGGTSKAWQWLALVGADFPLTGYAARGPLVAWTPHLTGVALKLDRPSPEPSPPPARQARLVPILGGLLLLLLAANLWATLDLAHRVPGRDERNSSTSATPTQPAVSPGDSADREKFALALYHLLKDRGAVPAKDQDRLLGQYERLAAEDPDLRMRSPEGKIAVATVDGLARRGPGQVEAIVREALAGKGYDPELVNRACTLVRERLSDSKR